jgi:carbamoyltransferase
MLVLGVGGFMHDYNCCLIDTATGRVAMAEAERQSRRKHHAIKDGDDLIAPIRKVCADLAVDVRKISTIALGHTDSFACKAWFHREFPKAEIVDVDHHLCHAAGAFFSSGFEEALVVSVDGFGDGSSSLLAHGNGIRLEEVSRTDDANSIGLEYLRATFHIGLGGYGAEGKTQGLAPYGTPDWYDDYIKEIEVRADGSLQLSDRLRSPTSALSAEGGYLNTQLLTNAFLDGLFPRRIPPEALTEQHQNLAASIQKVLEKVVGDMVAAGQNKTKCERLVLSGGVSMNSSMNGRLLKSGAFKEIYALPMSSDRGIGLGAALYVIHVLKGMPRFFRLEHVFYGATNDDKSALRVMRKAGLKVTQPKDPVAFAADSLAQGQILGWVRGRSELGARALGHRSILADPRRAEMKDVINARVKHREWFRPFAPVIPEERAQEYFDFPPGVADLGFMTFTVDAKEAAVVGVPATVHVDRTSRLQTLVKSRDPDFHSLATQFGQITGVPVLLNTSFNDKDEPIVETAEDAVKTFLGSDMDVLLIGGVAGVKS